MKYVTVSKISVYNHSLQNQMPKSFIPHISNTFFLPYLRLKKVLILETCSKKKNDSLNLNISLRTQNTFSRNLKILLNQLIYTISIYCIGLKQFSDLTVKFFKMKYNLINFNKI